MNASNTHTSTHTSTHTPSTTDAPVPTRVHYHKQARELELGYASGDTYRLPVELLRVYSPSAEVRGHGGDTAVLQVGKKDVGLQNITQAGNYALKLHFDDGHDSGLYSWNYLHDLATHQHAYWNNYLERLEAAGASREPAGIQFKQL
ncbi:gamma-butyrobetaine hydroxylase-like domain-containing protein [Vreelandella stevensii]|uniref:gamma-butyrobetaine hydroxylase-like domain-containing protein n=1 Tax=Vreelandella stevensii TaxID=502821 RepID=UPI00403A9D22